MSCASWRINIILARRHTASGSEWKNIALDRAQPGPCVTPWWNWKNSSPAGMSLLRRWSRCATCCDMALTAYAEARLSPRSCRRLTVRALSGCLPRLGTNASDVGKRAIWQQRVSARGHGLLLMSSHLPSEHATRLPAPAVAAIRTPSAPVTHVGIWTDGRYAVTRQRVTDKYQRRRTWKDVLYYECNGTSDRGVRWEQRSGPRGAPAASAPLRHLREFEPRPRISPAHAPATTNDGAVGTGSDAPWTTARRQDYHYKDSMEIIIFSKSFKIFFFCRRILTFAYILTLSALGREKKYFLKLFENKIISIESLWCGSCRRAVVRRASRLAPGLPARHLTPRAGAVLTKGAVQKCTGIPGRDRARTSAVPCRPWSGPSWRAAGAPRVETRSERQKKQRLPSVPPRGNSIAVTRSAHAQHDITLHYCFLHALRCVGQSLSLHAVEQ